MDSQIIALFTFNLPNWKKNSFKPYYNSDNDFKKIIDNIDLLQPNKDLYTSPAYLKLIEDINNTPNRLKKIQEFLFLKDRILYDTSTESQLEVESRNFGIDTSNADSEVSAKVYSMVASFFGANFAFGNSIDFYLRAKFLFEQNRDSINLIQNEENIAALYFRRNSAEYQKFGFAHLSNLMNYYLEIHDNCKFHTTELILADKKLYENLNLEFPDIVFSGATIRNSKEFIRIKDSLENVDHSEILLEALRAAENSIKYYQYNCSFSSHLTKAWSDNNDWGKFLYSLYLLLGDYFRNKREWQTAKLYYITAFCATFQSTDNFNIDNALEAINRLTLMFAESGNVKETERYFGKFCDITTHKKLQYQQIKETFNYADDLYILGLYKEGLDWAKFGLKFLNSSNVKTQIRLQDQALASVLNGYIYLNNSHNESNSDSLNFYNYQYKSFIENYFNDIQQMSKHEFDFKENEYNIAELALKKKLTSTYDQYIFEKNLVKEAIAIQKRLYDTIRTNQKISKALKSSIDSSNGALKKASDSLRTAIILDSAVTKDARIQKSLAGSYKKRANNVELILAILITIFISIILIFNTYQKKQRKDRELEISELDAYSRNLSHNIASDYNDLLFLNEVDNLNLAKNFTKKIADYLKVATNRYSNKWSLENEIYFANLFFETRNIIIPNLSYPIIDDDNLEIHVIKFPSDLLTTLLHNSIKHRNKQTCFEFKVVIRRFKEVLQLIITDNGIPSKPEEYFPINQPNEGLPLLRKRINARCKKFRSTKKIKDGLTAEPAGDQGTLIKITLPYETI